MFKIGPKRKYISNLKFQIAVIDYTVFNKNVINDSNYS